MNYAWKAELNEATGVHTSKLAAESDLAGWKAEVDKTDINNPETVSVDLSKLSNVVDNNVAK